MKTWICNTMCNFYGPLLGAARLNAYVKNQGYDIEFKDLNLNYFKHQARRFEITDKQSAIEEAQRCFEENVKFLKPFQATLIYTFQLNNLEGFPESKIGIK